VLHYKVIKEKSDKQKLLIIYIPLIKNSTKLCFKDLIFELKMNFNIEVDEKDLETYFNNNIYEEVKDKQQQILNLGIRYE